MGRHKSNFDQKVKWLVEHPLYWKGWPSAKFSDNFIIQKMKEDGLISAKSNNHDMADFGKLIAEARDQLRKLAHLITS